MPRADKPVIDTFMDNIAFVVDAFNINYSVADGQALQYSQVRSGPLKPGFW
jgi:hypothetical protein